MRRAAITAWSLAGAAMALAGCVTDEVTRAPFPSAPIRPASLITRSVSAGILPLGSVPYDNRSLPLVSPDGRFVATQTGPPLEWPALLAGAGATVPEASRVEVFQLDRELGEAVFARATNQGILLGRAGDDAGFLVESPRPDGARWIGYTRWAGGGAAQWLVADENVNAFGCLGPGGRLAWSRRAGDAEHFDLVIRRGGEEWTVGAQGGDWLLPIWSDVPDGLFALRLDEGRLELTYMIAESPDSTKASLVRLPLASERSVHDAYQCVASVAVMTGVPGHREAHLLFWHPAAERIGLWRPVSSPGAALLLLEGSISAAIDMSGTALVGTDGQVYAQSPANLKDRRALLPGAHVPRPVARSDWPYVLLSPGEQRIGLIALRLIPASHSN
ncbi:MAG: hypothetical protein ACYS0G_16095 [Planctomycetota bacterium]|jgi:hypothetical protein